MIAKRVEKLTRLFSNLFNLTTMKTFVLTLKHDNGKVNFRVIAQDEDTARKIICKAEGCPDRAIIKVKVKK